MAAIQGQLSQGLFPANIPLAPILHSTQRTGMHWENLLPVGLAVVTLIGVAILFYWREKRQALKSRPFK